MKTAMLLSTGLVPLAVSSYSMVFWNAISTVNMYMGKDSRMNHIMDEHI